MNRSLQSFIGPLCLLLFSIAAHAEGVSPYLPLKLDNLIELEIERLASITQMPNLTKPYPIVTVVKHLEKVKDSHPKLYQRLNSYIKRYRKQSNLTQFSLELGHSFSKNKTMPNSRGAELEDVGQISFASFHQFNKYFIANAGGSFHDSTKFVPHNSYLSMGTEYFQFDIGYREHWLSPAHESAQLLSTNAEPIASITLSNIKPITDFNIKYEVSFGLLEEMEGIHFDGKTSSGQPGLLTMHFGVQPFSWWTIGVNRAFMFGGGERSISLGDIWNAFIDPVSSDNCGGNSDLQDCNKEVGNQVASVTSKIDFAFYGTPISIFGEFAGEDTNDYKNYLLGNKGFTLGLFIPYLTADTSLYVEHSYFEDKWYVHHLYDEGYRNNGHVMGHWWGDNKLIQDDVGTNVTTIRVNWDINQQNHMEIMAKTIKNKDSKLTEYQRSKEIELNLKHAYNAGFIGLSFVAGQDTYGDSFSRVSVSYNW